MSYQNSSPKHPSRKHSPRLSTPVRLGVVAVAACFIASPVLANPVNPFVVNGAASFNQVGKVLTVTNSNGTIINWDKFSIKAGETTRFDQPSASSAVMNRVLNDPTAIYGTLSSNGRVWLINPAGIMVGPGGRIDTAAFVASTLNIRNEDFLAGRKLFVNDGTAKDIINQGEIRTPAGGSVYLIGNNVSNEGIITTPKGETILAAGATVSLIDSATPGVKVDITGAEGNSTNLGTITAEAGRIGIAGVIVRNSGLLNASSVVSEGGRVFLRASKDAYVDSAGRIVTTGTKGGSVEVLGNRVAVMDKAEIDARGTSGGGRIMVGGDYQGKNPEIQNAQVTYFGPKANLNADATDNGNGGKVIVWADDTTRAYGNISARGGAEGGNGGFVEVSGKQHLSYRAQTDTRAPSGKTGTLLLDPASITIVGGNGDSTTDGYGSFIGYGGGSPTLGSIFFTETSPTTVYQSEIEGQSASAHITLEATDGISTSGTFTSSAVTLASNSNLTLRTRNANPSDLATGINLTGSSDGVGLEFKTQGTGTITLETGLDRPAPITTSKLTTESGAISISSSGALNINGALTSGGSLNMSVGSSGISQSAPISVAGTTTLTATAGTGDIILNNTANSLRDVTVNSGRDVILASAYSGSVTIGLPQTAGGLRDVSIGYPNTSGIVINGNGSWYWASYPAELSGNLAITSGGSISPQYRGGYGTYSWLNLTGTGATSTFTAGGDIWFATSSNYLGAVTITPTIGTVSATLYNNSTNAGLTLTSPITNLTLTQPNNSLTLAANKVTGSLYLDNQGGTSITDTITLGGQTLAGSMDVRADSGIDLTGVISATSVTFSGNSISAATAVVSVGTFTLNSGTWNQVAPTLPGLTVSDFRITGGTFIRALGGDGSAGTPYQLADIYGVQGMGSAGMLGKAYVLANNIDASAASGWNSGNGFVPVGDITTRFTGTFDGLDHAITGLTINRPATDYVGLFGATSGATIRNVGLVGGSITGAYEVGGLVGYSGYSNGGTVTNSYSTGSVVGAYDVGGLVGVNRGAIINSGSTSSVSGTIHAVGGLVGRNQGSISNSYSTGSVSGNIYGAGGLVGLNYSDIDNCYSTGAVSGGSNSRIGGLVGWNHYGAISNSYSTGSVSGLNEVGGLVGYTNYGGISNSYSTGSVSGGSPVGGLVGMNDIDNTMITNSFWDTQTSGQASSAGGTGKTTAQMQTATTYTGWSAVNWDTADGSYPTLKNMPIPPGCPGYDNCWIGAMDSFWATAGNWSAGHAPFASESVKMDVAGTPTISIIGVNPSFGSLWLAENLDVDAGVTFGLSNLFTLTDGIANFNGTASVHSYAQTGGTLAGSGAFTVTNSFVKTGGVIDRLGDLSISQATGALNFSATRVATALTLNANAINLGSVGIAGAIGLVTDDLTISGAVSSPSMSIQPKTYNATTLGRVAANNLSLLQSDLDNLTAGYIYIYGSSLTVDSGSATPVTFAHVTDYLYTAVDQVAINSPLTLSQPGTALYLGASRIDINATPTVGAGGVFLGKNASNVAYLVGVGSKTYPANTVELTNAELRRIDTTGPVTIGDPYNAHSSGHGPMQIVGPIDLTDTAPQLRLVGNGVIQAAGATMTVPQLAVDSYGSISLPAANHVGTFAASSTSGDITFTNAGPLTIGKVATTASPYNFSTEGVIAGGGIATVTANGALTLLAGAGETVKVNGTDVWLTFNGDLNLNAGAGGKAYVEATSGMTHLDFSNSTGQVKFNGSVANAITNGVANPSTADFIGFWNQGVAAVPGSTLLLSNTTFSFGGAPCAVGFTDCWTGAVDSLWTNGGNWQDGTAPVAAGDKIKINAGAAHSPHLTTGAVTLNRIFLDGDITTDSGVSFNVSDLFTLNAGTTTLNGTTTIANYVQTGGTLAGSGLFTVSSSFAQSAGAIDRTGNINISHTGNLLLGRIATTGALSLTATGAIVDNNGGALNLQASTINLTSTYGGSPGALAISADTSTVGSITASVDSGASYGGISIRNSGAATPGSIYISDTASAGNGIAFSHGGSDLVLNERSHVFLMDNAGVLSITAGSNMTLDGRPFIYIPSSAFTVLLSAAGTMDFVGGAFALPNSKLQLQAASIQLGAGSSIEASSIVANVSDNITLDNGGHFHAANDIDLSFAGPSSTLSMSNGGYVLANTSDTIRLDFKARSSGGVLIDDVETITSLPGGSGLFVLDHNTPALPGAGLEITYGVASSAVLDLCAYSPTLCNPPNPGVSPLVTEVNQAPRLDEEKAAKCAEGSFGCEEEQITDGHKADRRIHRGRVATCL